MFKKVLSITFIAIILIISSAAIACAAPETLSVSEKSTATDLLVITRPENSEISVSNRSYTISGAGKAGIIVYLYLKDSDEKYVLLTQKVNDVLVPVEWKIGSSGLFMKEVELTKGKNSFRLYAVQDEKNYEIKDIDISLLNQSFLDKLKGLTVDITTGMNQISGNK